jgi:S-adenosylmethionine hydrolase
VLPWFPPAVHLVVVDPGVGTDRAALVLQAGDHALVGPDNGVLLPAARALAGGPEIEAFVVDDTDAASSTFHGRDVFAPAAATVHEAGVENVANLSEVDPTDGYVDLRFPTPDVGDRRVTGEVLIVDDFGNVVTNVPGEVLAGVRSVRVDDESIPVGETFASVPVGDRVVTVGSHGNVELDVNRGRGETAFDLSPGETVELVWD